MKKTLYLFNAAMGLILILGIAGCASSPQAEDQLVEEPQPVVAREEDPMEAAATALFSQIEEARREAEQAGAGEYYPEQLDAADLAARQARNLFSAGDAETALSEGRKALAWYRMLKTGMEIRDLRRKILEYSFDVEDPEGFADAETKYVEAVEKFELEHEQAEELSLQALAAYQAVCNNGFMRIAEEERARALEIIELCDSIKAARSMSSEYQAANETFDRAASLGEQNLWEDACKAYRDASILFGEVYQNALYKRAVAEEAMSAARARQEASTALALEADEIAPLPDEEEEGEASEEDAEAEDIEAEENEAEAEYSEGESFYADDAEAEYTEDASGAEDVKAEYSETEDAEADDAEADDVEVEEGEEHPDENEEAAE